MVQILKFHIDYFNYKHLVYIEVEHGSRVVGRPTLARKLGGHFWKSGGPKRTRAYWPDSNKS